MRADDVLALDKLGDDLRCAGTALIAKSKGVEPSDRRLCPILFEPWESLCGNEFNRGGDHDTYIVGSDGVEFR
jgi:hypothetical protein